MSKPTRTLPPQQLELAIEMPEDDSSRELLLLSKPRYWLQRAAQQWQTVHGRPMTVRWARDLALLKPLLQQHGPLELAARWVAYIQTEDTFLAARGWDVPTFSRCIDRYAGAVDRAEEIALRNCRPLRDPLSGVHLGRRRGW